jgi:hypothetical protein
MFETNLHDERFLPFEGAGAVSTWSLELPNAFRPFDYMTISDVLLHVRYTARQGVDRKQVLSELRDMLTNANESGLALLFSLPHDFPTEWSAFLNGTSDFAVRLRKDYFPYVVQSEKLKIAGLELYAVSGGNLKRRVVGPTSLVGDFNGPNGYSDLPLAPDDTVLKREQAPIFLLIRYSVVAQSGG